jgi:hypothetical protein
MPGLQIYYEMVTIRPAIIRIPFRARALRAVLMHLSMKALRGTLSI